MIASGGPLIVEYRIALFLACISAETREYVTPPHSNGDGVASKSDGNEPFTRCSEHVPSSLRRGLTSLIRQTECRWSVTGYVVLARAQIVELHVSREPCSTPNRLEARFQALRCQDNDLWVLMCLNLSIRPR